MRLAQRVVCVTALAAATLLAAGDCRQSPGAYQRDGYVVRNIRLKGPLRHFRFVREEALRADLPLRLRTLNPQGTIVEPGTFDTKSWSLGTTAIQNRLRDPALQQRFKLIIVIADLESCDAQEKTLDAVYNIFALSIPAGLTFDSQAAGQMVVRRVVTSGLSRLFDNTFPQPILGYNAARGWFGGTAATYQAPMGRWFNQADILITGSGRSLQAEAGLSGSRSRSRGALRDRDWGFNYRYSDLRGTSQNAERAVREKLVIGHFGTFTKPLGPLAAGLRFGTAIEGGSGQTDASLTGTLLPNSGAGSVKLYTGTTLARGIYTGRLSYGVQRTQPRDSTSVGFFKSIFDTRHQFRVRLADHRPLSIEVDAAGGWMPNDRAIPVHEAFYGGNSVRSFVTDDPWEMRADPLFRGLPQLSVSGNNGAFGATRFASVNTTAAFPVWARPLVPQEILSDAAFVSAFTGQITTAESILSSEYIASDLAFPSMAKSVAAVKPDIASIQQRLEKIHTALPAESKAKAADAITNLEDIDAAIDAAMEPLSPGQSPTVSYRSLALGFNEDAPATLMAFAQSLRELKPLVSTEDSAWLEENAARFTDLQSTVATTLKGIEGRALARSQTELAFARRVVDSLLHEVNLASISPLAMFDVARFGWQRGTPATIRYAAGPGIRFSLVNVNVSFGYAFNFQGPANSPRGALLFQLTVSDLFR